MESNLKLFSAALSSPWVVLGAAIHLAACSSETGQTPITGGTSGTGGTATAGAMSGGAGSSTAGSMTGGAGTATGGATTGGAGSSAGGTAAAGSTTGGSAGMDGGSMAAMPADNTQASISSFIATSDMYKGPGWEFVEPETTTHGAAMVYLNDVLVASFASGNDGLTTETQHPVGSMSVKELHDAMGMVSGHAVLYKAKEGGREAWTAFCIGPEESCYSGSPAYTAEAPFYYMDGANNDCAFCHGGIIITEP